MTKEEIIKIIEKRIAKAENPENPLDIEEKEMYKCPNTDCVMDCTHRVPHEHEGKYCDGNDGNECPACVPELISDVFLIERDFKI